MKKYFILGVALIFMLAFAMPAAAALKITGSVDLDVYWFDQDKEQQLGGGGLAQNATTTANDRTEFHMNVRRPNNYVQFAYTNDDGNLGAIMRLRGGSSFESAFGNEQTHFGINWIWWKPNPDLQIRFGTIYQIVGGLTPDSSNLGHQFGGTGGPVGINYGNIHTSERHGIGIYQKINKNISIEFGLYSPEDDNDALTGAAIPAVAAGGAAVTEELDLPRVDLGIPIKVGNFQTKPKFSILNKEYDQVAAGSEDSFTIWAASIDARITFGPLRISGEYTIAENLSEGNHTGLGGDATLRTRVYTVTGTASTAFGDTESDLWWLSARYQFSKNLALMAHYGETDSENDVNPSTTADDWKIETSEYAIVMEYKLFPNFRIYPTYANFDGGDSNLRGGGVTVNRGEEEVYGVKFLLAW